MDHSTTNRSDATLTKAIGLAEELLPQIRANLCGSVQSPPGSVRIRRTSAKNVFQRTPPNVRRTFGGVHADTGGFARTPRRTGGRVHSKNVLRQKPPLHHGSPRKNFRRGRPFAAEIIIGSGLGLGLGLWYSNPNPNLDPNPNLNHNPTLNPNPNPRRRVVQCGSSSARSSGER